ncbi:MAG: BatD family protein [Verrucomicrobia bacterium]|nr:BatD family protein [Verrucomicrobiota bacterium]
MTGRRQNTLSALLGAALAFLSTAALGAEVRVSASLQSERVYQGDHAQLQITIEGRPDSVQLPDAPDVPGLTMHKTNSTTRQTQIINGRVSESVSYHYMIQTNDVGSFTIPPLSVVIDGTTFATRELRLDVIAVPKGDLSRISVKASKSECWQYEAVELTYTWAVRSDKTLQDYRIDIPLLEPTSAARAIVLHPDQAEAEKFDRVVPNQDPPLTAVPLRDDIDGESYTVVTFRFKVYPTAPGKLVLPRASVTTVFSSPTNETDIFGRRLYNSQRYFAATDEITLHVKPLPDEGRPAGFTGPVGRFGVATKVSETRAYVDDPLRLAIAVTGDGLLDNVKRPLLSADPEFTERFRFTENLESGEVSGNTVAFEQIIRPKNTDVAEVPPVELSYFDTTAGEYRIARSEPIPIEVLPASAQKIETFGNDDGATPATELTRRPGGLYANVTSYAALRDETPRYTMLWALVVPPVAYAVVLVVTRRRRRLRADRALARSSAAWRAWSARSSALRRESGRDSAAFFDGLARAVGGYLSDKLNLGRGELTAADVQSLIDNDRLPNELGAQAIAVLERCDAARFAPQQAAQDAHGQLLDDAETFARAAERTLRRRR